MQSQGVVLKRPTSYRLTWRDAFALALASIIIVLVGLGAHQMIAPVVGVDQPPITLAPGALPGYALRTTLRMFAALAVSLSFTFIYATLAAKSRRAEIVLIPLLDVLQSVPILGYLSFTVLFFVGLFPGNVLGAELAAIFAIFTSQAWNMTFSFYQSLRTVPRDLDETTRCFRFTGWQRFWRLDVPFAMPGLVWNDMMSMSGGWFFVVAAEAISVGNVHIALPGIGSYVGRAVAEHDLAAVGWAILTMVIVIGCYDQLFFRPLVAWADKYRLEETASQTAPRSWVLDLFHESVLMRAITERLGAPLHAVACARLVIPDPLWARRLPAWFLDAAWYGLVAAGLGSALWQSIHFAAGRLTLHDLQDVATNGALTFGRVIVVIAIASVVWVPIGIAVGLRPRVAERVQPLAQFLAAFPANLVFPIFVVLIVRFHLAPAIWLTPLMILGTSGTSSSTSSWERVRFRRIFGKRLPVSAFAVVDGGATSCFRGFSPITLRARLLHRAERGTPASCPKASVGDRPPSAAAVWAHTSLR